MAKHNFQTRRVGVLGCAVYVDKKVKTTKGYKTVRISWGPFRMSESEAIRYTWENRLWLPKRIVEINND